MKHEYTKNSGYPMTIILSFVAKWLQKAEDAVKALQALIKRPRTILNPRFNHRRRRLDKENAAIGVSEYPMTLQQIINFMLFWVSRFRRAKMKEEEEIEIR